MAPKPLIRALLVLCAGFALLVGPSADAAKPGALDTTFGRAGKVITDFGRIDAAYDIAVQPNGKIVAVGDSYEQRGTPNGTFALARYTRSGALDQTFGTGGKVTTDFQRPSTAFAVALQPDGRIVAAGGTRRRRRLGALQPERQPRSHVRRRRQGRYRFAVAFPMGHRRSSSSRTGSSSCPVLRGSSAHTLTSWSRDTRPAARSTRASAAAASSRPTSSLAGRTGPTGSPSVPAARSSAAGVGITSDDSGGPGVIDIAVYDTNGHSRSELRRRRDARQRARRRQRGLGRSHRATRRKGGHRRERRPVGAQGSSDTQPSGALDQTFGIARNGVAVRDRWRERPRPPAGRKTCHGGSPSGRSDTDANFAIARFDRSGLPDMVVPRRGGDDRHGRMGHGGGRRTSARRQDRRRRLDRTTSENGITQSGDFALARYVGVPNCRVPNVIGKTLRAAKARIARANCRLGRVGHRTSARAARGHIVSQRPPAGTNLPNGGKVNLVVSLGRG